MCCIFCISFRGAAYFGTSLICLLGLGIVAKYSGTLVEIDWQDLSNSGGPGYFPIVIWIYGLSIFGFGCCIFRAVDAESLRALKVSVGGMTVLQCLVLILHLSLLSLTFDALDETQRMSQVSVLAVNLVLTFLLLTTLFLYMIRLARREWALLRRRSGSGSSLPLSSTLTMKEGIIGIGVNGGGRCSVGSVSTNSATTATLTNNSLQGSAQRYIDGQWENLHV